MNAECKTDSDKPVAVILMAGCTPVIPALSEGRLVNLSEYGGFALFEDGTEQAIVSPREFFETFIPTRLLFEGANRG